ncbi:hypothetical protein HZS_1741, partial [Henneguya salminicola]
MMYHLIYERVRFKKYALTLFSANLLAISAEITHGSIKSYLPYYVKETPISKYFLLFNQAFPSSTFSKLSDIVYLWYTQNPEIVFDKKSFGVGKHSITAKVNPCCSENFEFNISSSFFQLIQESGPSLSSQL